MKKIVALICTALMLACTFTACGETTKTVENVDLYQLKEINEENPMVTISVKDFGDIVIELFPEEAPKAVENFITLAEDGYFDGVTFHRVIKDFMVQSGDPTGTGMGGHSIWNKLFEDEFSDNLYNFNGALSMANSGANSNGSQFFIVQTNDTPITEEMLGQISAQGGPSGWHEDVVSAYEEVGGTPWLDGVHTVFGQVREGLEIVAEIENVEVDDSAKPLETVFIDSVTVEK